MSNKKRSIRRMYQLLNGEFETDKSDREFFYPLTYIKHAKIGFPVKKYRSIKEVAKKIKKQRKKYLVPMS